MAPTAAHASAGPAPPTASTSATARPSTPPRSPLIVPSPRKSSRRAVNHHNAPAAAAATASTSFLSLDHDPPSTPPPKRKTRKAKGKQPLRTSSDTPRADPVRVAAVGGTIPAPAASDTRHSHGLSWTSTTRDSVVDNLLFSLDNLSRGDLSQQDQQQFERLQFLSSLTGQFSVSRPTQRPRGHTHSSSASDIERPAMDSSPASKFSLSSKGRRSNSSSNFGFHPFGGRAKSSGKGRVSTDTQRPTGNHHEGASLDYGHSSDTTRPAWVSGKALSMDYMHAEEAAADAPSILGRGRPVPSLLSKFEGSNNDDGDAAPEPIVAAGPRKMQNPAASGPVYVNAADSKSKQNTLRKPTPQAAVRSPPSSPTPHIPQDIRNQAADFVRGSGTRGVGTQPAVQGNPAPNSGVGARSRNPSPPRERPGFFKRVFGSSRVVSTPAERPVSNQPSQENNQRPDTQPRSVSQAHGNPPHGDTRQSSTDATPQPPALNKKPSSFFRRRKKSISEAAPPPPVPNINTIATLNAKPAEPSPSISSLRRVMDPFLNHGVPGENGTTPLGADDARPDTAVSYVEDSEDPDIFHSGYTPPPDASLNQRHTLSRDSAQPGSSGAEGSPDMKMKMKKRSPGVLSTSHSHNISETERPRKPHRSPSAGTVRDSTLDAPNVSPLTETPPNGGRSHTPISRPSSADGDLASAASRSKPNQDLRAFSAGTNVSLTMDDQSWLVGKAALSERPPSKTSEEGLNRNGNRENLSPIAGSAMSSGIQTENLLALSAHSRPLYDLTSPSLPTLNVEHSSMSRESSEPTVLMVPPEIVDEGAEYRERARKIFDGDEEDVSRYEAAAWMGERNTLSTRTLQAYMRLFDFSGLNILAALRMLCAKLMLRGETQQFDRIITALSGRWCECNPYHGLKAQDVVHTVVYSLVLLNTDLHLADIEEKMSRSAYVKNTLPTIRRVVMDAAPNAFDDTLRPATHSTRPSMPWATLEPSAPTSPTLASADPSLDRRDSNFADSMAAQRLSIRPGVSRLDSDGATPDSAGGGPLNTLVGTPWTGSLRGWEAEIEAILKSFYNSIRAEPLPLLGAVMGAATPGNRNLSVVDLNSSLKRNGSVISKAPSDNMSYRSKQDLRSMTMRWQGRGNRSRPKLYPASTVGSSRTSFDDGSGIWSPAQSSKYSFSKTLTSASVGSFGQFSHMESFKHSIGFANALSQAIIREEAHGSESETFSVPVGLLEDESLALEGAPWAKEGLVKHKHHMEVEGRRAKDRNWTECFAVLSKGKLTLFNFNTSTKSQSMGKRNHFHRTGKAASVTAARVGGGDWMENAEQLDVFILRQTIASTLPPPGYGKTRPHVWALSLPSGAVHLFQVGTPDIAEEFMSTANYWSARLSKEPLAGGVSNIEYGWSDRVVNTALVERKESFAHPPSSMQNRSVSHTHSISTDRPRRSSLQSSMRTSFDTGFGSVKAKLPGDKAHVVEWQPPTQSMMASQLMEVDQLKQLTAYVQGQEEELEKHNELKHAIELAFSPRHPNHNKAMANWQRKSDYILREIVKFRTYIDSLSAAQKAKDAFYAKKAETRPLSPVAKDDDVQDVSAPRNLLGDVLSGRRNIHTSG